MGVVLSATPSADGQSLEVETADGGQGSWDKQSASRQIRTFTLSNGTHSVTVKSKYTTGWLQSWIAVGGDVEDDGAASTSGGLARFAVPVGGDGLDVLAGGSDFGADAFTPGTSNAGPDPLITGAVLGGVGLLLMALALRAGPPKPPGVNALVAAPLKPKPVTLTFNFPYALNSAGKRCWNDADATRRRQLERHLDKAGVEMTGMGAMMGCGRDAGSDIDVRTRTPRRTEALVRRLASRSGLEVGEVRPWNG